MRPLLLSVVLRAVPDGPPSAQAQAPAPRTSWACLAGMPGWIGHWHEMRTQKSRIHRPRQVYTGHTKRDYTPMAKR